jgi:hypothetical protein
MRFRGLFDPSSNLSTGPWSFAVSLTLLQIYLRVHEVPKSPFKPIYGSMSFGKGADPHRLILGKMQILTVFFGKGKLIIELY